MSTRAICCVLFLICVSAGAINVNSGPGAAVQSPGPRSDGSPWWDDAWAHRARIFIDNHLNNEVLTEFPIPVHVPYRGGMQPDFADLRFTDYGGSRCLPYWIEEYEPSSHAEVWVRVPEIPAVMNVYIYYGNPSASSESSAEGYAELCEPFDDDPTRPGGWNVYRHAGEGSLEGCWDPADGALYLTRSECDLGVALFSDLDMTRLSGWVLTFDYLAGGGTGAEGLCAMFYKDEAPYAGGAPSCGGGLGFTTAGGDAIPGYGVEFDASPGDGDHNKRHAALIQNRSDNHLVSVDDDRVSDGMWHGVEIVYLRGNLTASLDQSALFEYNLGNSGGDRDYGGLGFCAATGELTNDHLIDNVLVRKWTEPMPTSMVGDEESLDEGVQETTFGQIKALFQ